jgi:hypothetical protein
MKHLIQTEEQGAEEAGLCRNAVGSTLLLKGHEAEATVTLLRLMLQASEFFGSVRL